jgi:hypothetical protein
MSNGPTCKDKIRDLANTKKSYSFACAVRSLNRSGRSSNKSKTWILCEVYVHPQKEPAVRCGQTSYGVPSVKQQNFVPLLPIILCQICHSRMFIAKIIKAVLRHHYRQFKDWVSWRVLAPQTFKNSTPLWFYKGTDSSKAYDVTFNIHCLRKFHAVNKILIIVSTEPILHCTMGSFIRSAYTRLELQVKSIQSTN